MQKVLVPLSAGSIIHKRYVVEALQSKSDSGDAYLVRDLHSKNIAHTLFVLKQVSVPNKQERYRLFNEAVALRELQHGGLPCIYQVINDDRRECVYLLMEYIEGQNLEKLRRKQPEQQFSWSEAMSIMAPILTTVSYLHHQQPPIIHGAIKPANIIVLESGFIRSLLVDLCFVKEYNAIPIHSANYSVPVGSAGGPGIQDDIYALGATFYWLLTGIVPVDIFSRIAQLKKEGSDPLKQVNEVAPAVPPHIARAVDQALSLDADNRFSSVDQMWEAFWSPVEQVSGKVPVALSRSSASPEQAIAHLPTVSAPEQPMNKKPPPAVRNWKTAVRPWKLVVPVVLLVVLVGLGARSVFWIHAESQLVAHATIPTPGVISSPTIPRPTPSPGRYPSLAGTYKGTIFDLATNISTTLTFNEVQQNQGHISGYLTMGSKLQGSGYFSGTFNAAGSLQFVVTDPAGHVLLFFAGAMQSATDLSGDYYHCGREQGTRCLQAPGDYGIWNVGG